MAKTIEKKEALKNSLYEWVEKVLRTYETDSTGCTDTFRMIANVDKIVADAFEHDPVIN